MWVVHENGSRVATASAGRNASRELGPYYVGDTVHLFCVAYGGEHLCSIGPRERFARGDRQRRPQRKAQWYQYVANP